jgi:outer membrane receptor protein involved in Fe transport
MSGPTKKPYTGSQELTAAISSILAMATASAQEQPPPASGTLGEIIVTATKRAERLQDVPESITAFDTDSIAKQGLKQLDDYARLVPGMSVSDREPGGTTIVFRGVTTSGLQFGSVSSSALYLDEQPITQSGRSPDPRLIDIERVEALRGPQGTLYGASSQSGTLRIITAKPDTKAFDAWAEAQLSNTSGGGTGYDISAMLNAPLVVDKFALRLVGFTAEDAGFIDRVGSNSQGGTFNNDNVVDDDVNTTTTSGGRAALLMNLTDNVNATLSAVFQDVSADGHGDVTLGAGDLNQVRFEEESLDDKWYQLALTVNAALPFGDAVFVASYFERDFNYEADATDYEFRFNQNSINCVPDPPDYYCTPIYDFGGDPRGFATNHEEPKITTFEARLSSRANSESRWAWLVGAFYSREKEHTEFDSFVRGYADTPAFAYFYYQQPNLAPTETWFLGRYDTELDQVAVFGELSFDLTENFTITGGGRWFDYDRKFAQIQESPQGFLGEVTYLNATQKSSEDGTVWKLNLTYHLDRDRLLYATYSEGFRVGGSNPLKGNTLLPRDYDSDVLTNYEVGVKSEWLNHRLRLNVSAYYMKWDDFAVQVEDPQDEVFQLGFVNLASADIPGVEAEFAITPNEHWQIDGSFAWNDAEIAEDATLSVTDPNNGNVFDFTVNKGARLPLTPDFSAALGIEFRPSGQLFNADPYFRFDYSYVGESVNSLEGIESVVSGNPVDTQEAYQVGDVRFGLEAESWSASLFVDNVWDERANLFLSNRWAVQREAINRPRTVGVQFRYSF